MYGQTDGYIFNEKNVSGDRESVIIDATRANKISVVYKWTGNLAGDFEVWASNDDFGGMGIGFFETNITFDTNPAGTPGIAEQEIDSPNKYYMIKFDHTVATAGNLYMSLATRFDRSLISKPIVRFADASFTNTSPRYLGYNNKWPSIEAFAGGVLATRRISGRLFAQIEISRTNYWTYSQQTDQKSQVGIGSFGVNSIMAPDGTVTADTIRENGSGGNHDIYQAYTPDGSSRYCFSAYIKAKERIWLALVYTAQGFGVNVITNLNASTGTIGTVSGTPLTYGVESAGNGWYRVYHSKASTAASATTFGLYMCNADNALSYTGDGASGLYVWNPQIEIGTYPSSPIHTPSSSTVARNADQLYWASVDVPSALRRDIKIDLICNRAIAAGMSGGDGTIIEFDESGASNNIHVYLKASDGKIYVDDETGVSNLVTTGAVTASRGQKVTVQLKPSAGQVILSGFTTGNGTTTGTSWSTSAGNVYHLQTESNTQQWGGLGSEPY